MIKKNRTVPYNLLEDKEQDEELKELGWTRTTVPDGRTFYQNTKTGEKSWETPSRLVEVEEQPPEETKGKY